MNTPGQYGVNAALDSVGVSGPREEVQLQAMPPNPQLMQGISDQRNMNGQFSGYQPSYPDHLNAFAGEGGPSAASEWLQRLEYIMVTNQLGQDVAFSLIQNKLYGPAGEWHSQSGLQARTFEDWKAMFIQAFCCAPAVATTNEALCHQLHKCKQYPNESIENYIRRKQHIALQLGFDAEQTNSEILAGLHPRYGSVVEVLREKQYPSVSALLQDLVDSCRQDYRGQRRSRDRNHQRSLDGHQARHPPQHVREQRERNRQGFGGNGRFQRTPRQPLAYREQATRPRKGGEFADSDPTRRYTRGAGRDSGARNEIKITDGIVETAPLNGPGAATGVRSRLSQAVKAKYQPKTVNLMVRYNKLGSQYAEFSNNVALLSRCANMSIIPKTHRVYNDSVRNTRAVVRLLDQCSYRVMIEDLEHNRRRKYQVMKNRERVESRLKEIMSPEDFEEIRKICDENREVHFAEVKERQRKEYQDLLDEYKSYETRKNRRRQNSQRTDADSVSSVGAPPEQGERRRNELTGAAAKQSKNGKTDKQAVATESNQVKPAKHDEAPGKAEDKSRKEVAPTKEGETAPHKEPVSASSPKKSPQEIKNKESAIKDASAAVKPKSASGEQTGKGGK